MRTRYYIFRNTPTRRLLVYISVPTTTLYPTSQGKLLTLLHRLLCTTGQTTGLARTADLDVLAGKLGHGDPQVPAHLAAPHADICVGNWPSEPARPHSPRLGRNANGRAR